MANLENVEQIKIELAQTAYIKDYEYWSQLTEAERIEVTLYRTALVARLNELSKEPEVDTTAEVSAAATLVSRWTPPKRPGVFDRYQ